MSSRHSSTFILPGFQNGPIHWEINRTAPICSSSLKWKKFRQMFSRSLCWSRMGGDFNNFSSCKQQWHCRRKTIDNRDGYFLTKRLDRIWNRSTSNTAVTFLSSLGKYQIKIREMFLISLMKCQTVCLQAYIYISVSGCRDHWILLKSWIDLY